MSTNELEKQFFDTFKILKQFILPVENFKYSYKNYKEAYKINRACNKWGHQETIDELKRGKYEYPTITDHILLELICILNTVTIPDLEDTNIGRLKKTILEECIRALTTIETPTKEEFINNIRTLFKRG